jgi:site-specific DNA-methyltransferase (adenine-specific)
MKAPPKLQSKISCGDALDLLPTLPDHSINLCLTSPPYAEQRKKQYTSVPECDCPAWMVSIMAALKNKLADDGSVLIVIRSHVRGGVVSDYVLRTRLAIRESGWKECEELIWRKTDAPPLGHRERPRRTWEHVLWFSQTNKPYVNLMAGGNHGSERIGFGGSRRFRGNRNPLHTERSTTLRAGVSKIADHFAVPVTHNANGIPHPAMFPAPLCEKLILAFSREGDVVCDPFAGSGQTLLAARNLKHIGIGFDINAEYVELARKRLRGDRDGANPGDGFRLRPDFPQTARGRRAHLVAKRLVASDASVFEFVIAKTINGPDRIAASPISVNQIATATDLSRRTVIHSLDRLRDAGMIETIKNSEWNRHRSSLVGVAQSLLFSARED